MNANLSADALIALGLSHQIKYPLYYIKKLKLIITPEQSATLMKQREQVEKQFVDCELTGKKLTRKIDDNVFINFADLIFNNLDNAEHNLHKIRISLSILKDGQAVFTNLEKLYLYRYVFAKGIPHEEKIKLTYEMVESLKSRSIKRILKQMLKDKEEGPFKNNNLRQDKLLWIAREYKKQGIYYTEIANTDLCKPGLPAIEFLEEVHEIMPKIEEETGVKIRFLAAIRRIPLTIIKPYEEYKEYILVLFLINIARLPYSFINYFR